MRLRFSERAVRDLSEIGNYLYVRNPAAARRVRAAILDSVKSLRVAPRSGRRQHVEGVRKLVVRRYPYLIYYALEEAEDEIVVIAIQHSARRREFADI
jgi:addiction module RelE/StbE family toxin